MSYILEALRKADAERERGVVPDLHAQLQQGGAVDGEFEAPRPSRWRVPAALATALMLALGAWWFFGSSRAPETAPPPVVQAPAQVQPTPASAAALPVVPPTASASTPAASAGAAPTAPTTPAAPTAPTTPAAPTARTAPAATSARTSPVAPEARVGEAAAVAPAPRAQAKAKALSDAAQKGDAARAGAAARPAPATAPATNPRADKVPAEPKAANVAAAPPARVPPLSELPEDLRRQLPPLAIGGSVYSPQAAKRMVIVNGQVFLEGATLAPELQLEQIRPKTAVFSIRGQRFELPL